MRVEVNSVPRRKGAPKKKVEKKIKAARVTVKTAGGLKVGINTQE